MMMNNKSKNNPNYRHGRYVNGHTCCDCGTRIDPRSKRCYRCRALANNSFKGKKHSLETKKAIGKASSAKFTKEFIKRVYEDKYQGNRHKAINGYTLITSYDHPNRDSHNNVLEHILIMTEYLGRELTKDEIIHHINFIRNDNRLENLYLCDSRSDHGKVHYSINKLIKELLEMNVIEFKDGEYAIKRSDALTVGGES